MGLSLKKESSRGTVSLLEVIWKSKPKAPYFIEPQVYSLFEVVIAPDENLEQSIIDIGSCKFSTF